MRTALPTGIGTTVTGRVMPPSIRSAAASAALGKSQRRGKHSKGQNSEQQRLLHDLSSWLNAMVHSKIAQALWFSRSV